MQGVYLIHFERAIGNLENPLGQAQHYLGYADDIDARLARHQSGDGARLVAAFVEQGIAGECVRRWEGATREDERRLHNQGNNPRLCPRCREAVRGKRRQQRKGQ